MDTLPNHETDYEPDEEQALRDSEAEAEAAPVDVQVRWLVFEANALVASPEPVPDESRVANLLKDFDRVIEMAPDPELAEEIRSALASLKPRLRMAKQLEELHRASNPLASA